ncbi:MAG: hypothetical protein K5770_06205 [Lachnospiraceae bacterium]|nr:hypothetical protein [Lachnospiraceae bacterium]
MINTMKILSRAALVAALGFLFSFIAPMEAKADNYTITLDYNEGPRLPDDPVTMDADSSSGHLLYDLPSLDNNWDGHR